MARGPFDYGWPAIAFVLGFIFAAALIGPHQYERGLTAGLAALAQEDGR